MERKDKHNDLWQWNIRGELYDFLACVCVFVRGYHMNLLKIPTIKDTES